jgi:plastocyanin
MLLVAACGGSASPASSSGASPSAAASAGGGDCSTATADTVAAATVTIRDFAYAPTTVTIKAGEAVAWTNMDTASHTATTTDGGCDTKSIAKGETVALVFPTAGTYTYHCAIHATMPSATVEVTQ